MNIKDVVVEGHYALKVVGDGRRQRAVRVEVLYRGPRNHLDVRVVEVPPVPTFWAERRVKVGMKFGVLASRLLSTWEDWRAGEPERDRAVEERRAARLARLQAGAAAHARRAAQRAAARA